jgi:DNA processing protein
MESDEKFYLAALARCPGLGSRWLQKLCQSFASPRQVWHASAEELVFRGQLPGRLADKLAQVQSFGV